jgi:hypothetical protein
MPYRLDLRIIYIYIIVCWNVHPQYGLPSSLRERERERERNIYPLMNDDFKEAHLVPQL